MNSSDIHQRSFGDLARANAHIELTRLRNIPFAEVTPNEVLKVAGFLDDKVEAVERGILVRSDEGNLRVTASVACTAALKNRHLNLPGRSIFTFHDALFCMPAQYPTVFLNGWGS